MLWMHRSFFKNRVAGRDRSPETLLSPGPLRTVRESFPSYGSSLCEVTPYWDFRLHRSATSDYCQTAEITNVCRAHQSRPEGRTVICILDFHSVRSVFI